MFFPAKFQDKIGESKPIMGSMGKDAYGQSPVGGVNQKGSDFMMADGWWSGESEMCEQRGVTR